MQKDYWFRARSFGFGASLPLNWKGWVHLAVLLGGILASKYLIEDYVPRADKGLALAALLLFFIVPMIALAWRKTEGGWHWRD